MSLLADVSEAGIAALLKAPYRHGGSTRVTDDRRDKVEERIRLRGHMISRGIQHIERPAFVAPVGEQIDKSPTCNQAFNAQLHDLGDTVSSQTYRMHRTCIINH